MSEVITRPQKAKSTTAKPAPKAPAKVHEGKFTPYTIKAAFGILEVLLHSACKTDEAHGWSGDSDRLLRIAAGLADEAHINTPDYDDAERVAFDIAALIKAAKLVPGDTESPERADLINQAAVQLNWLTECDEGGSSCIDVGAARPVVQPPASTESPSSSERAVAATGASLLGQAIKAINDEGGAAYAADLLKVGQKALLQASEGVLSEEGVRDVFFLAAGASTGALAIEQRDSPSATHRHQLITTAFDMLNNAGLSYDCELYPCAEAAAAIEAGARLAMQPVPVASPTRSSQPSSLTPSTEQARQVANSAICHLEAAKEVLFLLGEFGVGDEAEGLLMLVKMLWAKHASTDEAEDIGSPGIGAFSDLQRELSIAHALAALVRQTEEGAMSAVDYLLADAARLMEDALHLIPRDTGGPNLG